MPKPLDPYFTRTLLALLDIHPWPWSLRPGEDDKLQLADAGGRVFGSSDDDDRLCHMLAQGAYLQQTLKNHHIEVAKHATYRRPCELPAQVHQALMERDAPTLAEIMTTPNLAQREALISLIGSEVEQLSAETRSWWATPTGDSTNLAAILCQALLPGGND